MDLLGRERAMHARAFKAGHALIHFNWAQSRNESSRARGLVLLFRDSAALLLLLEIHMDDSFSGTRIFSELKKKCSRVQFVIMLDFVFIGESR